MADTGKRPVSMRIRLKYPDVETFIDKYSPNISRGGMFVQSRAPQPVGTWLRFELVLKDGTRLLKGEGRVIWVKEYDASKPGQAHGMGLRFTLLDQDSERMVERVLLHKGGPPPQVSPTAEVRELPRKADASDGPSEQPRAQRDRTPKPAAAEPEPAEPEPEPSASEAAELVEPEPEPSEPAAQAEAAEAAEAAEPDPQPSEPAVQAEAAEPAEPELEQSASEAAEPPELPEPEPEPSEPAVQAEALEAAEPVAPELEQSAGEATEPPELPEPEPEPSEPAVQAEAAEPVAPELEQSAGEAAEPPELPEPEPEPEREPIHFEPVESEREPIHFEPVEQQQPVPAASGQPSEPRHASPHAGVSLLQAFEVAQQEAASQAEREAESVSRESVSRAAARSRSSNGTNGSRLELVRDAERELQALLEGTDVGEAEIARAHRMALAWARGGAAPGELERLLEPVPSASAAELGALRERLGFAPLASVAALQTAAPPRRDVDELVAEEPLVTASAPAPAGPPEVQPPPAAEASSGEPPHLAAEGAEPHVDHDILRAATEVARASQLSRQDSDFDLSEQAPRQRVGVELDDEIFAARPLASALFGAAPDEGWSGLRSSTALLDHSSTDVLRDLAQLARSAEPLDPVEGEPPTALDEAEQELTEPRLIRDQQLAPTPREQPARATQQAGRVATPQTFDDAYAGLMAGGHAEAQQQTSSEEIDTDQQQTDHFADYREQEPTTVEPPFSEPNDEIRDDSLAPDPDLEDEVFEMLAVTQERSSGPPAPPPLPPDIGEDAPPADPPALRQAETVVEPDDDGAVEPDDSKRSSERSGLFRRLFGKK